MPGLMAGGGFRGRGRWSLGERWRTGDPRDACTGEMTIILTGHGVPSDICQARAVGSERDSRGFPGRYVDIERGSTHWPRWKRWPDGWIWIPYPEQPGVLREINDSQEGAEVQIPKGLCARIDQVAPHLDGEATATGHRVRSREDAVAVLLTAALDRAESRKMMAGIRACFPGLASYAEPAIIPAWWDSEVG
jgi:hypothetical protein